MDGEQREPGLPLRALFVCLDESKTRNKERALNSLAMVNSTYLMKCIDRYHVYLKTIIEQCTMTVTCHFSSLCSP